MLKISDIIVKVKTSEDLGLPLQLCFVLVV